MKTPRELLLNRHAAAQPRLDALRAAVLASLPAARAGVPARSWRRTLWEQLVVVGRPAWIGLAAAWILIVVLNSTSSTVTEPLSIVGSHPTSPEVEALLAAQRQLLVELTAPVDPPRRRAAEPLSRPSGSVLPRDRRDRWASLA